jgi:two-component system alkaline phosphatase synthesis response regulator PhoP
MSSMLQDHSESGDYAAANTPSILIVDDDPSIVNLLKESFTLEGFKVHCGFDGQMAIQMARKQQPDIILLDVSMPMTNGLKAFQFLRSHQETSMIPVIFLSGELSKDIYPIVENGSRVAHLKKPMDLEHLNSMVRQFIQKFPVPH